MAWQHFCQEALAQNFQFFVKMAFFSFKTFLYRIFWLEFEISASELTFVPNFSSIGQKIREIEFWPGKIPKMAWRRHTYLLLMTSATFLRLLRDCVPEYHHAKFDCNWTTNKGETEGGHNVPPPSSQPSEKIVNLYKQTTDKLTLQRSAWIGLISIYIFRKLMPFKSKINHCFLLLSLLEPIWCRVIWMLTFWGKLWLHTICFGSPGRLMVQKKPMLDRVKTF